MLLSGTEGSQLMGISQGPRVFFPDKRQQRTSLFNNVQSAYSGGCLQSQFETINF